MEKRKRGEIYKKKEERGMKRRQGNEKEALEARG
jgi:hypothetical protein